MRTDIVQKAIILNDKGQLLALKRNSTDDRRPLQWDLPGGMLDHGELLEEGVLREIEEETGLKIVDVQVVYTLTEFRRWQDNEANIVRIFYLAKTKEDNVTLSYEHSEYEWMYPKDAIDKFEYAKQIKAIEYLIEHKIIEP